MSVADDLMEQVKTHQEIYAAGVRAADENSPSARKLARLIALVQEADDALARRSYPIDGVVRSMLRDALKEANEDV